MSEADDMSTRSYSQARYRPSASTHGGNREYRTSGVQSTRSRRSNHRAKSPSAAFLSPTRLTVILLCAIAVVLGIFQIRPTIYTYRPSGFRTDFYPVLTTPQSVLTSLEVTKNISLDIGILERQVGREGGLTVKLALSEPSLRVLALVVGRSDLEHKAAIQAQLYKMIAMVDVVMADLSKFQGTINALFDNTKSNLVLTVKRLSQIESEHDLNDYETMARQNRDKEQVMKLFFRNGQHIKRNIDEAILLSGRIIPALDHLHDPVKEIGSLCNQQEAAEKGKKLAFEGEFRLVKLFEQLVKKNGKRTEVFKRNSEDLERIWNFVVESISRIDVYQGKLQYIQSQFSVTGAFHDEPGLTFADGDMELLLTTIRSSMAKLNEGMLSLPSAPSMDERK